MDEIISCNSWKLGEVVQRHTFTYALRRSDSQVKLFSLEIQGDLNLADAKAAADALAKGAKALFETEIEEEWISTEEKSVVGDVDLA